MADSRRLTAAALTRDARDAAVMGLLGEAVKNFGELPL
jgi:hypothetical protein